MRPTLLKGPATISPTNHKATIIDRDVIAPGRFDYVLQYRLNDADIDIFTVPPEEILDYVSAAELEKFESQSAREERQQLLEQRFDKSANEQAETNPGGASLIFRQKHISFSSEEDTIIAVKPKPVKKKKRKIISSKAKKQRQHKDTNGTLGSSKDEEDEFEVEAVLQDATVDGSRFFLVKWAGYSSDDNSWLPEQNVVDSAAKLVKEYLKTRDENYEISTLAEHEYDSDGELFFRVEWKGYPGEDTWEPESHLPSDVVQQYLSSKSHVSSFFRKDTSSVLPLAK